MIQFQVSVAGSFVEHFELVDVNRIVQLLALGRLVI